MTEPRLPAALCALSALTAAALLTGCSGSVSVGTSEPTLSKEKLADAVAGKLAAQTGQPKPGVTCPENLPGKAGATTRCTLTVSDGSSLGVTAKVTSVDDGKINFAIEADKTPTPAQN